MKSDRELLELAGRAIGYRWDAKGYEGNGNWWDGKSWLCDDWNPLDHKGDALRLAIKLKLVVDTENARAIIGERLAMGHNDWFYGDLELELEDDEAVCRAIVRAAAAVGEQMR